MILVDTGPVLALLNANDDWHSRCLALADSPQWDPVIPSTVLVELDYMIRRYLPSAAWTSFVSDVLERNYRIEIVTESDIDRALNLCKEYEYMKLQFVDASIVAVAERLLVREIATVDRRDFRRLVPRHCDALNLFPVGGDQALTNQR